MKLVKIEKDDELWYFTRVRNAAQYLNAADAQIYNAIKQQTKYKGWQISQFDYNFNTALKGTVDPKI